MASSDQAEHETDDTDELAWVREAAVAADDKLAVDTVIIDVGDVLAITGWFLVTSGSNPRQVRAIVDAVEERLTRLGGPKPLRVEGLESGEWVLMDYGDFIVHVFGAEARTFYDLERLWADRPRVQWQTA